MKISIVIPSYNSSVLWRTLSTLAMQTHKPHEIIVVDDGSDEPLRVIPDGLLEFHGVRVVRIERKSGYRGSSAAKNIGAKAATGDYLIFSDDDILHLPDAIESVVQLANSTDVTKLLLTVFSLALSESLLGEIGWSPAGVERLLSHFADDIRRNDQNSSNAHTMFSEQHFGFISKSYFDFLGGYDEHTFKSWGLNNQDLCLRVINSGGDIQSNIRRVKDGSLLHCFHYWNPPEVNSNIQRSKLVRDREFKSKYGRHYSSDMLVEREMKLATG